MHIRDVRNLAVAYMQFGPVELEHLDFDAVRQTAAWIGPGGAPHEYSRVPSRFDVHPFDVQDEVLVLLLAAHHADGMSGADQQSVADSPGILGGIDVDPPGQILAIEQIPELRNRNARRQPAAGEEQESQHHSSESLHSRNLPDYG